MFWESLLTHPTRSHETGEALELTAATRADSQPAAADADELK